MVQADVLLASLAGVFVGALLMLQFLTRESERTGRPAQRAGDSDRPSPANS